MALKVGDICRVRGNAGQYPWAQPGSVVLLTKEYGNYVLFDAELLFGEYRPDLRPSLERGIRALTFYPSELEVLYGAETTAGR